MINMKVKSKLFLMVSLWEILLTWAITRTLDYLVKWIGRRLKLKINVNFHISGKFYMAYLTFCLRYVLLYRDDKVMTKIDAYRQIIDVTLSVHRRMHRNLKIKSCQYCRIITKNENFFKQFAPDPKLYPPFKFSKN